MHRRSRLLLTIFLAVYGAVCLMHPGSGGLLDAVDLGIHETGHLVFAPFGEFLGFAGGTLAQLIMPAVFAVYFWRQGDRHAATVPLWWVAQNLWNISVYVADARAQALPLVGGGEHDWAYMLGRLGWLQLDTRISRLIWLVGVVLFLVSIVQGVRYARTTPGESIAATGSSEPSHST
jgi:hypothetical protein